MDAWLYETCTQCLQHMVDIVALFYKPVAPILPRIFDLLSNFIRCLPTWSGVGPSQREIVALRSYLPSTHSHFISRF